LAQRRLAAAYYIEFAFGVILKGNGPAAVAGDVIGIAVLGAVLFVMSRLWFERRIKVWPERGCAAWRALL
jgi:hypothetical protein